jgi:hypothetical protein
VLVVRAVVELLAQRQHKMEVALVSWRTAQPAVAVELVLLTLVEMAGQEVAAALVPLLRVRVAQETHQAHHPAKVVAVGLQLLTTSHQVLVQAVAVVLADQQHQMGQVHQVQRPVMVQMAQHPASPALALPTLAGAVAGAVALMRLVDQAVAVLVRLVEVLVYRIRKWLV